MRATRAILYAVGLGLCLLGTPILRLARCRPAAVARISSQSVPGARRDAAEQALRQGRRWRARAVIAASRDREALEAWDPAGMDGVNAETWRVRWMAADPAGDLRHAKVLAQQAAALARSRDQAYAAAVLLVLLDHDRGDHQAAEWLARRLVMLRPRSVPAHLILRLAERRVACGQMSRLTGSAAAGEPANVKNRGFE